MYRCCSVATAVDDVGSNDNDFVSKTELCPSSATVVATTIVVIVVTVARTREPILTQAEGLRRGASYGQLVATRAAVNDGATGERVIRPAGVVMSTAAPEFSTARSVAMMAVQEVAQTLVTAVIVFPLEPAPPSCLMGPKEVVFGCVDWL